MGGTCSIYGERRGIYRVLRVRDHCADPALDEGIILRWICRKWDVDRIDLAQEKDRCWGTCECGNESSGSIKCGEFLDCLRIG